MKKIAQVLVVLIMIISITFSCSKETSIGSDLVEQDVPPIQFTDTLTMKTSSILENPISIFNSLNSYLWGNFVDPVFGRIVSEIYFQFRIASNIGRPDFTNSRLDSLILLLEYSPPLFYGDSIVPQHLQVYKVIEDMTFMNYDSDQTFEVDESLLLGEQTFIPANVRDDSVSNIILYNNSGVGTSTTLNPHLRITLNPLYANTLLLHDYLDTTNLEALNENLLDAFKGLYLKTGDISNDQSSMLGFRMNASSLMLYYTKDDTLKQQYVFGINNSGVKLSNIQHDISGTVLENHVNNTEIGDTILYLQGMVGPNIKIDIPYAKNFKDKIIVNKAELEFTISKDVDADTVFHTINQIGISEKNTDGEFTIISDVTFAFDRGRLDIFGGDVEESVGPNNEPIKVYRFNISSHFQEIIDNEDTESSIFLRILDKSQNASRTILYGPGHSQFPAKLTLTYTNTDQ